MHIQDGKMKQKGFTLIEILVVMLVGGMVMAAALSTIYSVVWDTDRSRSQTVALTDVAQAARQIKEDLFMAQSTNLDDGIPQSSISLTWIDRTSFSASDPTAQICSYVLLPDTMMLQRTYNGKLSVVGRNITSLGFTQVTTVINDRVTTVINVVITATGPKVRQRVETLEFSVRMRPEVIEQ